MPIKLFGRGASRMAVVLCALVAGGFLYPQKPIAASDPSPSQSSTKLICAYHSSGNAVTRLFGVGRRLQAAAPIRILSIGSSSTQGIGASSPAHSYPALLEGDLKSRWPKAQISVLNAGIGGETVATTTGRLEHLLGAQRFDLVIWQLGTNDALGTNDSDAFRKQVLRGVDAARMAGVDLVLLDPQYFPGIRNLAQYERFVDAVGDVGTDEHVPVFRRYAMMKEWMKQGEAKLISALSPDRFHMNDRGYGCLAEALTAEIGRMAEPPTLANAPTLVLGATK